MQPPVPRFWMPEGHTATLSIDGFLPDPGELFSGAMNRQLVATADLPLAGWTMLLGEPGMGKTTALDELRTALADRAPDGTIHRVDLGSTGQEARLRARIFEAPAYAAWQDGDGALDLLLDGLDEARLRVDTVAGVLFEGLEHADVDRMRLWIACRSGARHRGLEERMKGLVGPERFAAFELQPLRRRDIKDLARARGLDADRFIRDVLNRHAQPLASRPITLSLLLSAAARGGSLPESIAELYRQGCRAMAQEPDEDRRTGLTAGRLNIAERIAIAARIAAATLLSGRVAVSTAETEAADPEDATLEQLSGGRELRAGAVDDSFTVAEADVRETLDTALVVGSGDGRFVFAHQTIAEYLAATYLAHRMRPAQMLDLLMLEENGTRAVVPQLAEVATWLATLAPRAFDTLVAADPDVVLRGDLSVTDDTQRATLVDALLRAAADGTLPRHDLDFRLPQPASPRPSRARAAARRRPRRSSRARGRASRSTRDRRSGRPYQPRRAPRRSRARR